MSNSYFQFKQFTIQQDRCAMKVTTDGCLFGAWATRKVGSLESGVVSQISETRTVLDVGTGTGLLALMLAQEGEFSIDAVEVDKDAFQQASENVAASPWADRIKVFHADIREFEFPNQYDIIISNPPFYEKELKGDDAKKNIAHHNEGLLLPELLAIIKKNLKPGGSFFLLLPYKRNEEIRKMFTENDLAIQQLTFVRQSTKHDFFRIMLEGKLKTDEVAETIIDEISIKDEQDQYTPAFVNLLKDYYLHL
jgi:tRNA1Val (adenine37-N6)-methyltransferase